MTTPESSDRGQQERGRSPHERGNGIFFADPPPVDPQKEGPTEEEIKRSRRITGEPRGEKGKVSIPVVIGLSAGGTTLLTVGGVGGYFIHDAFASETLDSVPGGTSFSKDGSGPELVFAQPTTETKRPNKVNRNEVFDNNATKGTVSLKNILFVPEEEIAKTPLTDGKGNPILDFPLPWDPNNPLKMKYKKIPNYIELKGTLPAGVTISTPYPGNLFFFGSIRNEEASRKSPSNPYGLAVKDGPRRAAKIIFQTPNGTLYAVLITVIICDRKAYSNSISTLEPLIEAPLIGPENRNAQDWEKGAPVGRGVDIFKVEEGRRCEVDINMQVYPKGTMYGPVQEEIPGDFLKFQTGKDPSSGVEKLLVPEAR